MFFFCFKNKLCKDSLEVVISSKTRLMIRQLFNIIYKKSTEDEITKWDHVVKSLNEDCLLSIQRYDQMKYRLIDAKVFMEYLVYQQISNEQKDNCTDSNVIKREQYEKSTQTINERQRIDDIIRRFLFIKNNSILIL